MHMAMTPYPPGMSNPSIRYQELNEGCKTREQQFQKNTPTMKFFLQGMETFYVGTSTLLNQ